MSETREAYLARRAFELTIVERAAAMTRPEIVEWANTFRYTPKATSRGDALNTVLRGEWARHEATS